MISDNVKKYFLDKYKSVGSEKFYKFLLVYAIQKLIILEKKEIPITPPNIELLECYDQFIILYRREGEEIYLDIAKIFRKVAHKIYRVMLKRNLTPRNDKFLNLICQL